MIFRKQKTTKTKDTNISQGVNTSTLAANLPRNTQNMVKKEEIVEDAKVNPAAVTGNLVQNNDSFGRLHTEMDLGNPPRLNMHQSKTNEEEEKEFFPHPISIRRKDCGSKRDKKYDFLLQTPVHSSLQPKAFDLTQNEHFQRELTNKANEFRKTSKGRKRKCFVSSPNIRDFFQTEFMSNWEVYLQNLSEREREVGLIQKGAKFVSMQFFKDLMKFYRMVFRLRFHRCDKRRDSNQSQLVETLLNDLGFSSETHDNDEVFEFLYPVLHKLRKREAASSLKSTEKSFTRVYEEWSEQHCRDFLGDPLGSQFITFFIVNFGEQYVSEMHANFQKEVKNLICTIKEVLNF